MNRPLWILLASVAFVLGGCARTHRPATVAPLSSDSFMQHWAADLTLKGDRIRELYLRDNILFAYTQRNHAYAIDAATGQVLFVNDVAPRGAKLQPPIVLPQHVVYPSDTNLEVYSRTGKRQESVNLELAIRGPGVGLGTLVFLGVDHPAGARFLAADITKPQFPVRWELMTFGAVSAAPALHQGTIYMGSLDGRVYALNPERTALWPLTGGTFITGGPIRGDLQADDFGVYVASGDSKLYCLDRTSGRVKWQYFAGQALHAGPVVGEQMVYQMLPGKGLVAIAKAEGPYNRQPAWNSSEARQVVGEDQRYTFVRGKDNAIVALDRASGARRFQSKRHDLDVFATGSQGTIYAATAEGVVLAIKPVPAPGTAGQVVLNFSKSEALAMR